MIAVRVIEVDFDPGEETVWLGTPGVGAVSTFVGLVRGDEGVIAITLEHYPGMTERALQALAEEAAARWKLAGVTIVHRVGRLAAGERIVFVGAASPHRAAAIEACAFLIDGLKTRAPFWKAEHFADGRSEWVKARQSDEAAAAKWAMPAPGTG